jgi:NADPH:quinone reductase-like Zn-dependent oxidoreductase
MLSALPRQALALAQHDTQAVRAVAARADVVYDATGGALAETILNVMPVQGTFVCYGLLSGQIFRQRQALPRVEWFHIRNYLDALNVEAWQDEFCHIWPKLCASQYSDVTVYPLAEWKAALNAYRQTGSAVNLYYRWTSEGEKTSSA